MFRPTRTARWNDKHKNPPARAETAVPALPLAEAQAELNLLFNRTATADKMNAEGHPAPKGRCPQPVVDGPRGKCDLVLRGDETRCTFHTAPARFASLGHGTGDVYRGAPICTP